MRHAIEKLLLLLLLSWAMPLLAEGTRHGQGPVVENAWIPEAPPVARVMAGYLVIRNPADDVLVLKGAESSSFHKVEIHRTEMRDGMATMKRQERVEIPPRGRLELAPGGLHLMLIGPKKRLDDGDEVTITLQFEGGRALPVQFTVRPMEGMAHHHHHH